MDCKVIGWVAVFIAAFAVSLGLAALVQAFPVVVLVVYVALTISALVFLAYRDIE